MHSHWEKNFWFSDVDFTIIGSGLVGLFTAICLKKKRPLASVRVLDSHAIPQGASTKNAGFACFGTVGEILDDLEHIPEDEVMKTIALRFKGLELMKQIVDPKHYSYNNCGGSEIYMTLVDFEKHADNINKINGLCSIATEKKPFRIAYKPNTFNCYNSLIFNSLEGQLNPVLLLRCLIKKANSLGVDICFGHKVSSIEENPQVVNLNNDSISFKSEEVIITNNAFATELLDHLDIKPARNQVLVSQPLKKPFPVGTYHFDKGYIYFRNLSSNRVLIGGARNIDLETESTLLFEKNNLIVNYLKEFCERNLIDEDFVIESHWSGIMGLGHSKQPVVKQIKPGLRVGVRLGGMGVAIGAAVAEQLVSEL